MARLVVGSVLCPIALMILTAPVMATPITVDVTGAVTSSQAPLPFVIGDLVSGTFTYDSNALIVSSVNIPGFQSVSYMGNALQLSVGASSYTAIIPTIDVTEGVAGDFISFFGQGISGPSFSGFTMSKMQISLNDTTGTAFTGVPLPLPPFSTASFGQLVGQLDFFSGVGGDGPPEMKQTFFSISSFSLASAVPEPETYAMLLAGLSLLVAVRRRKLKESAIA